MQLKLLGITYFDDEIHRMAQLRALEWDAFPVFATRSFAPIAMFWIPWWELLLVLAALSLIWCPIRNGVASPTLSASAALLNMFIVALVANVVIALVFFFSGRVLAGCVALGWQLVTTVLSFAYPPSKESALLFRILSRVDDEGFIDGV